MLELCEHGVDKEQFCVNCELRSLRHRLAVAQKTIGDFAKESLQDKERTRKAELRIQKITVEISCRVDHGAESNGHLEALQSFLKRKDW